MRRRWLLAVLFVAGWATAIPSGGVGPDADGPKVLNEVIWPIGG